ncbi:MAG: MarR family winged helix-turn-helix transcriptional regulator [Oscillospiraceae bacterium]
MQIVEKMYQTVNIFTAEAKQARDYGTGHLLYHAEVHLITAIYNHKNAKASELAEALGITNGALTQVAHKLVNKGLIERYKLDPDKRETYFRLTQQGRIVYHGHEQYHKTMHSKALEYLSSLNNEQIDVISTLLDKLTEEMPATNYNSYYFISAAQGNGKPKEK